MSAAAKPVPMMESPVSRPPERFSRVGDRLVYDNNVVRLWHCSECRWWRNWSEDRCCACGRTRDRLPL